MAGPDYLQPSVTKVGGISVMLDIARLAEERGVALGPHSPYFGPGLIATIHLLAAGKGRPVLERFYCDLEASPLGDAVLAEGGSISVPRGPGLGVTVDEAMIARYRV
jgi:L-alanine-DL-glutamate epimerase-like enolase superfamily enzyme